MAARIGITNSPTVRDGVATESVNRSYVDSVLRAGGFPFILPVLDPAAAHEALDHLDGLVLSGGGDIDPTVYGVPRSVHTDQVDPARDAFEIALVGAAVERGIPVLGVCRGSQVINVARGGTLMQHLPDVSALNHREADRFAEKVHPVRVLGGSTLASIVGAKKLGVNTLHHQAVADVGAGLHVSAWAPDGIVEAVEAIDGTPVLGVQWHPELLPGRHRHERLFAWVVDEAEAALVVDRGRSGTGSAPRLRIGGREVA